MTIIRELSSYSIIAIVFGEFSQIMYKLQYFQRKIDRYVVNYIRTLFGRFPCINVFTHS